MAINEAHSSAEIHKAVTAAEPGADAHMRKSPGEMVQKPLQQLEQRKNTAAIETAKDDPKKMEDTLNELGSSWETLATAIQKLLESFGIGQFEFDEARYREPGTADAAAENNRRIDDAADKSKSPDAGTKIARRGKGNAEHAASVLNDKADWRQAIREAETAYGVRAETLVAFMEMESGCNEKAKCPTSSARGLAQAMPASIEDYRRGKGLDRTPDLTNPLTAIDFMGWHIARMEKTTNALIDQKNLPDAWKLNRTSGEPKDIENLYLAYNSGPGGYIAWKQYEQNGNETGLVFFQRRRDHFRNLEGANRALYAKRTAACAAAFGQTELAQKEFRKTENFA